MIEIFNNFENTTIGSAHELEIPVEIQIDGQLTDSSGGKDTNNNYFGTDLTENVVRTITLSCWT